MKNKFLTISVGVTLMLFGAGFLLRSMPTATAAPTPETFVEEGTSKIGKYMFQVVVDDEGKLKGFVMDTETGKSKAYSYGYYGGSIQNFSEDGRAFPDKPFGQ